MTREKQFEIPLEGHVRRLSAAIVPPYTEQPKPETPYEKARRESETQARFNLPDEPMRLVVRQKRCPEHGALPILVKNSPDQWKMECPEVGCLRSTPTVKTSYAAICHWNAAILLET